VYFFIITLILTTGLRLFFSDTIGQNVREEKFGFFVAVDKYINYYFIWIVVVIYFLFLLFKEKNYNKILLGGIILNLLFFVLNLYLMLL